MCTRTRKPSLGLVKVRKTSTAWKKSKQTKAIKEGRVQAKRSVRFASKEEVAFRHVTREELQQVWYQPNDYDSFKGDCRRTIKEFAVAGGDVTRFDPIQVCLRGLEQHTSRATILSRKMRISSSISFVLQEQELQKCTGQSDPERVREISRVLSEASCNRAVTVAAFDEKISRL